MRRDVCEVYNGYNKNMVTRGWGVLREMIYGIENMQQRCGDLDKVRRGLLDLRKWNVKV